MNTKQIDLMPWLLDCQIMDKNGRRCGKVDDLAVTGGVGKELRVKAILVGTEAWYSRQPTLLRNFFAFIFRDKKVTSIPWEYVAEVKPLITLNVSAQEVGLGQIDSKVSKLLRKIPGG